MSKRYIRIASLFTVLLWASVASAQTSTTGTPTTQTAPAAAAQKPPDEGALVRRQMAKDVLDATVRVSPTSETEWSTWPYLFMLILAAFAFEGIRQWRRETAWRRVVQDLPDADANWRPLVR